jgi:Protein of unknown function (DUF3102)
MTQALLKLVEGEPDALTVLMTELRAKAQAKAAADRLGLEVSLAPIVDEIELALSEEHGELEELRRLARLREAAAQQHAIRIGKLLLQAKRKVPHGQWQEWVKEHFSGKAASEYMHIAKVSKRAGR